MPQVDLRGASLAGANLQGANLPAPTSPTPVRANLSGANLQKARNLTQAQLDAAGGDDRTMLPEGLTRPAH